MFLEHEIDTLHWYMATWISGYIHVSLKPSSHCFKKCFGVAGYSAVTPGFHRNVMIVVFTPENVECCIWLPVSMRLS